MIATEEIKSEYTKLIDDINYYNKLYYIDNISEITDKQYDDMLVRLIEIESNYPDIKISNSPSERVGSDISNNFDVVEHNIKMLSISNTYNELELSDFYKKSSSEFDKNDTTLPKFIAELKIDGFAVSLHYKNGKLFKALTRGDGTKGEDITENVKCIYDIPLVLKNFTDDDLEVRGEIYMKYSEFTKINNIKKINNEQLLMNTRNAAAGAIKRKKSIESRKTKLNSFIYSIVTSQSISQEKDLENLKLWGFQVEPNYRSCNTFEDFKKCVEEFDTIRKTLDYQTDGIVFKVNSINNRNILGAGHKFPKWLVAYKFPSESKTSKLLSIDVQVGKSGALTPVANFEPIELGGTIVKRATLHNFDNVSKLDIRIGDYIEITKAGEIIPNVTKCIIEKRKPNSVQYKEPTKCPCCGTTVIKESEKTIICPNDNCVDRIKEKIRHWASRNALDIKGLGPAIINQLVDLKLINSVSDLYKLTSTDLSKLDQIGEKTISNLLNEFELSKQKPFKNILYGLNIDNIGHSNSEELAEYFENIDKLLDFENNKILDNLIEMNGFGETKINAMKKYFKNSNNITLINELKSIGFNMVVVKKESVVEMNNSCKQSYKICVTGTLEQFTRNKIEEFIKEHGSTMVSTVSKSTDYLVCGENAGSKLTKATALGIPVISESDLINLLECK